MHTFPALSTISANRILVLDGTTIRGKCPNPLRPRRVALVRQFAKFAMDTLQLFVHSPRLELKDQAAKNKK
jgi:hypothetical protein